MSTTTATSLSDTLPSSIPKLDSTGSNWAIFRVRFQDAVEAKGFWAHYDGSKTRPVPVAVAAAVPLPAATSSTPAATPATPAAAATMPTVAVITAEEQEALDKWDKDE